MPRYIVHLYREMCVTFADIEAATPQAAADHASGLPTEYADAIDDCDGEDFGALVDLQGDEEYIHSFPIDFESERLRKAVPHLLEALVSIKTALRFYPHWQESMVGHLTSVADSAIAKTARDAA